MSEPRGFGDGRLLPFADSIWTATTPIRFAATWQPHVMTVVRFSDGDVLLHSPCRLSSDLRGAIAKLGPVTDVIAPNWFHDLYLAEYHATYPDATFWGPAFLKRQRKTIIDCVLDGDVRPKWFAEMPYVTVPGLLTFDECLFYHEPTRTLIVADLLMNASVVEDAPLFTKFGYRLFGLNGSLKVFPLLIWFGQARRAAIRKAVRQVFEWNPERLIVGHGTPIGAGAAEQLQAAFSWLKAS
jgi:hypothetical protein